MEESSQSIWTTARNLFLPSYLPTFLHGICMSILIPVLPLMFRSLGATDTHTGVALALIGLGTVLADVPAGGVILRYGKLFTMKIAIGFCVFVSIAVFLLPTVPVLMMACFLWGFASGFYSVARTSHMKETVREKNQVGRMNSFLGGAQRMANTLGPLVGGTIAQHISFRWAILAQAPFFVLAVLSLHTSPPEREENKGPSVRELPSETEGKDDEMGEEEMQELDVADSVTAETVVVASSSGPPSGSEVYKPTYASTFQQNKHCFATVGVFCFLLCCIRASRKMILPLAGANIKMGAQEVGIVNSVSFCIDAAFFWLSGVLMDKIGRKAGAAPACLIMGAGMVLLGFCPNRECLYVSGILTGFGNSLSSGVVLVLGMDNAPLLHPSIFLGMHIALADLGSVMGPLLLGICLTEGSFQLAAYFIGFIASLALLWLFFVRTKESIDLTTT